MDFTEIKKTFEKEGFLVSCFETKQEAADYLAGRFQGEVIGFGGSATLDELGVYDRMSENNTVLWHWKDPAARDRYGEFTAYLTGANAVAESGEIVNIDGTGNRVSATLYGPKKVVFVCGKNKIAPDLASAIARARSVAAPPNTKRLHKKTPCAVMGRCVDCASPERICRAMVIYMRPMSGALETELVFINEELGY